MVQIIPRVILALPSTISERTESLQCDCSRFPHNDEQTACQNMADTWNHLGILMVTHDVKSILGPDTHLNQPHM